MRAVITTVRFENRLTTFLRRHPEFMSETQATMQRIASDPYASPLRTHRLKGVLEGCLASRLSREYRIVLLLEPERIVFLDIGTHDDVYR